MSCKCLGFYGGTVEVGFPFIWAVLLRHWVIGVHHLKIVWWLFFFTIIWIGVQFHALPPGSTAASVAYCMIPRFLNIPTLAARCLSRPQPAVVP